MESDSPTSAKQEPQPAKQGEERPPTDVQDAALNFILKLRKGDPKQYERPKVKVIDKRR